MGDKKLGARAKKKLKEKLAKEVQQKQEEDAMWVDTDKHRKKKLERQQSRELKKIEKDERKRENKELLEEEQRTIERELRKTSEKDKEGNVRKTRRELELARMARERADKEARKQKEMEKQKLHVQRFSDENPNHIQDPDEEHATGVEAATQLLMGLGSPTKSSSASFVLPAAKMTYSMFEKENMSRVKKANPNLRTQQVKAKIKSMWRNSPKNPDNHT